MLGRPRVLVLDDPLSALDVHTEALVEQALRRVLRGTTALVVAHRPSTVLLADRVALLDGGRIAAVGTHSRAARDGPRATGTCWPRSDRRRWRVTATVNVTEADERATTSDWRGVAAEDVDELPEKISIVLRPAAGGCCAACCARTGGRSWLLVVVVLIAERRRDGRPVAGRRRHRPRHPGAGRRRRRAALVVAGVAARRGRRRRRGCARCSCCAPAGWARRCCSTCARRLFDHVQRLSPAFHERYTSGRVIARLTSDVDALDELLDEGLDGLVTALLSVVSIGVHPAGPGPAARRWSTLATFLPLYVLSRWFRPRSFAAYRRDPGGDRAR